jgi:NitT/TauT family transport system substrate-binding protein
MKRRSLITSALLFSLSLSAIVGCSNPAIDNKVASTPKASDLKLGFSAWVGYDPWQVAQEKGILKESKIGVDLQLFNSYVDSITALNTGNLDANSQTLIDTISSIATGEDLVIVLTNDNSTGSDKIIVSDKIRSLKDLKGKKVTTEQGTVDHFLLALALKRVGMTMKDIGTG